MNYSDHEMLNLAEPMVQLEMNSNIFAIDRMDCPHRWVLDKH